MDGFAFWNGDEDTKKMFKVQTSGFKILGLKFKGVQSSKFKAFKIQGFMYLKLKNFDLKLYFDTRCQGGGAILLKKSMAIIRTNNLIKGISGSIGNLVMRNVRGKTILSSKVRSQRKESALQQENRMKFRCASAYAKHAMLDPDKKAYYLRKAKKLKLPNAYTAALGEYMREGKKRG